MPDPLLTPEIRAMLIEDDERGLASLMTEMHPARIADLIADLSVDETWRLFDHAPLDRQAEVFAFLPIERQVELASGVGRHRMASMLERLSHDDRVDLLHQLDDEVVDSILPLVAKADREDIRKLQAYPEHSAGAAMTTDYATLPPDITIQEAIARVRQQASDRETIYYIYVVDDDRRLVGFISLRKLILTRPSAKVADIMRRDLISVRVEQDREEVARMLAKYDVLAMPVVDDRGRMVGIITFDDVADIVQKEATEDFHKVGGIAPLVKGYAQSAVWTLYSRRVGWLLILVFVNLISSGIIASYEETLEAMIALAFFLPLLIDSGGNTGSQGATLIIRALATHEIKLNQVMPTIAKELVVGLALGATMAVASSMLGFWRGGYEVAIIVGLSMVCIVVFTNLIGVTLPFLLTKLRLDPAVASSPLITTIADATGLLIYFTIATWVLGTVNGSEALV